jgi:taurine dioxygenase
MTAAYRHIEVTPLGSALGAEIGGVDIAAGVGDDQFGEIWRAFIDHGVVFFRDQDITPDQHIAFAERWGEINVNRFFRPTEVNPKIAEVLKEAHQKKNIGSGWHTDHSYDQLPAMCSMLYAKEVPPVGGDTLFASTCAAYEALSDGMKQMLHVLRAEHSSRHVFGESYHAAADQADLDGRYANPEKATQDAVHPVIIRHPLSGRPSIYVNGDFTVKFEGWSREESQPLLDYLYAHITRPEFCYRFQWRQGSIAIWDNRATQHNAINDYHGYRRLMHRITIEGVELDAA